MKNDHVVVAYGAELSVTMQRVRWAWPSGVRAFGTIRRKVVARDRRRAPRRPRGPATSVLDAADPYNTKGYCAGLPRLADNVILRDILHVARMLQFVFRFR